MAKLTKAQRDEKAAQKAEDIEAGFYAMDRATKLYEFWKHLSNDYPRREEYVALTRAAISRAADLVLDGFGGTIKNKQYWPPKGKKR